MQHRFAVNFWTLSPSSTAPLLQGEEVWGISICQYQDAIHVKYTANITYNIYVYIYIYTKYIYGRANGIYITKSCNLQPMDSLSLFMCSEYSPSMYNTPSAPEQFVNEMSYSHKSLFHRERERKRERQRDRERERVWYQS